MQMKALRSLNFAKLSSSRSTSDEYWVTSISAGTPAGYCLSQMRSMAFPSVWGRVDRIGALGSRGLTRSKWHGARFRKRAGCLGNIEQCGGRWQAAAGFRRVVINEAAAAAGLSPALAARRGELIGRLRLAGRALGLGRL